ncbi:MAG: hypothetical protein EOO39_12525 [Cytophagaceae bacterium]|nr:MAG: hypothetical protein EOO39_12525 [Cytophagaceae bacterium]
MTTLSEIVTLSLSKGPHAKQYVLARSDTKATHFTAKLHAQFHPFKKQPATYLKSRQTDSGTFVC